MVVTCIGLGFGIIVPAEEFLKIYEGEETWNSEDTEEYQQMLYDYTFDSCFWKVEGLSFDPFHHDVESLLVKKYKKLKGKTPLIAINVKFIELDIERGSDADFPIISYAKVENARTKFFESIMGTKYEKLLDLDISGERGSIIQVANDCNCCS